MIALRSTSLLRRWAHLGRPGSAGVPAGNLAYRSAVSIAAQPSETLHLTVLGPQDAIREAKPMPSTDEMAIDGLAHEEWDAFERALAEG